MSIFGLPLIMFRVPVEDDDMSDFQYLSRVARGELPTGIIVNLSNDSIFTVIMGTVPAGKDWYLINWSISYDNIVSMIELEYPTGTIIDGTIAGIQSSKNYNGVAQGNKITAGQTITITTTAPINKSQNIAILQVDAGASLVIP